MTREHIKLFLESESAILAPSSIQAYKERLAVFARYIENRNVSPLACKNYVAHLLKTGRSRRTVGIYYAALQSLHSWLLDAGIISANPVPKLKRFPIPAVERQPITSDEIEKLLAQAAKDNRRDWTFAIRCAWETGLRLGDVATLRWHEVNVIERVIRRVPIKTQRFGKVVEIPISAELLQAMRETPPCLEGDQSFVCPNLAQLHKFDAHKTLSAQFGKLARKAGVKKSFHMTRHAFVSRLLNKGVGTAIVQSMSGHSLRLLAQYSHVDLETKRAAVA